MNKNQHKKTIGFFVRLGIFSILMLILLSYCLYVLTPKYAYGICSMLNFYAMEQEQVDVLAVGTSLTYTDLNTNILFGEYGITAYDLASAEQPFWSTYFYLKEALSIHKPKVVLLDLKAITYLEDKVGRTRTVLCSYGILNPLNRLRCIWECVEPEEFWSYAFGFAPIHTNYEGTTADDFALLENGGYGPDWKGYIEKNATIAHETPEMDFTFNTALNVNLHEAEYFVKILELCEEQEVPLLLVGYPNADYMHDHLFYCTALELAEPYQVPSINYNLPEHRPPKINYSTDCADWQHLNIRGSVAFTRMLAEDLRERYDLPDHRGDPAYASYERCAEDWFSKFPLYDRRNYQSNLENSQS